MPRYRNPVCKAALKLWLFMTDIPVLSPFLRPKRLTLKGYKQYWFTFKDTTISYFKSKEESCKEPIQQMNLKGDHTLSGSMNVNPAQTHNAQLFLLGRRLWGGSGCECCRAEVLHQVADSWTRGHEWGLLALWACKSSIICAEQLERHQYVCRGQFRPNEAFWLFISMTMSFWGL